MPDVPSDAAWLESVRTERHPDRDAFVAPPGVLFQPRTVIGRAGARELTADLLTPETLPARPRPAIVFLHGGAWRLGSPSQFHFQGARLAERFGCLAVSVDYRLSPEATFPAALHDAKCAVRWVRSVARELKVDPRRVAVAGGSAGAHLAALLSTSAGIAEWEGDGGHAEFSSRADLAVLFNGSFDLPRLVREGRLVGVLRQFLGASYDERPELYRNCSPSERVQPGLPPTLLLHGTRDACVPHTQAAAYAERLRAAGVHVEVELYEGAEHAWFNEEPARSATCERLERFLVERFGL
jgi:acetyl esterase/lipase